MECYYVRRGRLMQRGDVRARLYGYKAWRSRCQTAMLPRHTHSKAARDDKCLSAPAVRSLWLAALCSQTSPTPTTCLRIGGRVRSSTSLGVPSARTLLSLPLPLLYSTRHCTLPLPLAPALNVFVSLAPQRARNGAAAAVETRRCRSR